MALFGRRGKDSTERPISQVELKRAVDEGFLISKAAVVIAVANRIITNSLRDQGFFDHAVAAEATREELHRMAEEQRGDAQRMREIRSKAIKQKGRSKHQHDYRRGDDVKLRTREAQYEQLATMLDRRRDDQGFVDGIVLAARARAWDDIGTTVVGRLGWAQRPTEGYEIGRDDRVQQMLDEDFAALLAEHPVGSGPSAVEDTDDASDGASDDDGTDAADADTTRS
ncbi:hypothetical protein EDF24_0426 [Curtobacterium sp. PhB130]|uniref:hypothetical protein n=1 Tax=unclassified Curtobacterium TaxID=257496 RepID=UPI000F4BBEDF|nr:MULTISPECIES: hypothetical protein [unclassified Curtobacterium]ROS77667.1 hypothetical protein EDF24_0426 [Curtobacterium sp. PhB130]TCK66125.1 hypothetical protein EDF27_0877 [Curtobacterium sp. PhB136]